MVMIYNQWLSFLRDDACKRKRLDVFNSLSEADLRQKFDMETPPNIFLIIEKMPKELLQKEDSAFNCKV